MLRPSSRPFVGRGAERKWLAELWKSVCSGQPTVVLISGDAGAGKTRLLEETAATVAAGGGMVIFGSCVEVAGMGLPYLPIIDALRSVEAIPDGRSVLVQEANRWPALARLLPHLVDQREPAEEGRWFASGSARTAPDPSVGDDGEALLQGQLFQALHRVLTRLAEIAPVLLIIEDLHWADRSTRDLLSFLARTLRDGRVELLASYRSDDLHRRHPLRSLLAELTRLPYVERFALAPFTRQELAELLDGLAAAPVNPLIIEQVFQRSEGNAFFAEELFSATQDPGGGRLPDDLVDVLLSKVQALPVEGREVLKVAAVAGRRTTHDLLLSTSAADGLATEDGLRYAVEAGLLAADGETYSFKHALVQEAVYGDLLPGERVRLHGRFAAVLAGRFAATAGSAELAHHRLAAHDLPGALQALEAAATEAEAVAAPAEALRHLERAIELLQRLGSGYDLLELLTRAAEAAAASGDPARAVALGRAAVAEADVRGNLESRVITRERLALCLIEADESPDEITAEALDLLRPLQAEHPSAESSALLARVLAVRARILAWPDPEQAVVLLGEAERLAEHSGAAVIAADVQVTRSLLVRRGMVPGDSSSMLAAAMAWAAAIPGGVRVHIRALRFRSGQLLEDGDLPGALDAADQGIRLAAEAGLTWTGYGLDLRLMRGWVLIALGQWDEALRVGLGALYAPTVLGRVLATQAFAVLAARDSPEAEQLLVRLRSASREFYSDLQLDILESAWRLEQGRFDEGIVIASQGVAALLNDDWGTEAVLLATRVASGHASLAAIARREGNSSAAAEHQRRAETAAQHPGARRNRLTAQSSYGRLLWAHLDAEVARAAGHDTAATWAALAELADGVGRVPERMHARWREARTRLDAGDRGPETVRGLRAVLTDAELVGAAGLSAEVRALVRRVRMDPEVLLRPTEGPTVGAAAAPGALTAREIEVLQLVAGGRSNRQIGKELFISDKTASVHVSHILEKLGAASRTEAAALARQLGLLAETSAD